MKWNWRTAVVFGVSATVGIVFAAAVLATLGLKTMNLIDAVVFGVTFGVTFGVVFGIISYFIRKKKKSL